MHRSLALKLESLNHDTFLSTDYKKIINESCELVNIKAINRGPKNLASLIHIQMFYFISY